jgi:hypothetical protein
VLQEANHAFELNMKLFSSFAPSLHRARGLTSELMSSTSSSMSLALSDVSSESSFEIVELISKRRPLYPALLALVVLLSAVWLGVRKADAFVGLAGL